MRKVLYRGQRKNNHEWVFGNYVKDDYDDKTYIVTTDASKGYSIMVYEVIPETVGQCTNLFDKNKKEIFEGDIITATTLDTGDERKAIVGFGNFVDGNCDDEYIGFYIEFEDIKVTITQLAMEEVKDRFEVIGNIHDNSELLKEE